MRNDAGSHDSHDADHSEDAQEDSHASHGFVWDAHIHASHEDEHVNHGHHEDVSAVLIDMIDSGEVSFFDTHHRRFWSNLLVNGFFFFGIALGALFYLALHYATESGWGVVLLRIMEGIMSAMPVGIVVLLVVFIAGSLGMHHIYPWMDSDVMDPNSSHFDKLIYGKKAYLNQPFFLCKSSCILCYFLFLYEVV